MIALILRGDPFCLRNAKLDNYKTNIIIVPVFLIAVGDHINCS